MQNSNIQKITLALLYEYTNNLKGALAIWYELKEREGCERTISILRKLGEKDQIVKYSTWVFEKDPDMALKLFTGAEQHSDDGTSYRDRVLMTIDEVIEFLESIQLRDSVSGRRG